MCLSPKAEDQRKLCIVGVRHIAHHNYGILESFLWRSRRADDEVARWFTIRRKTLDDPQKT
jgi:hypothetical protein